MILAHCTKGKKPSNVVAVVGEVSRLKTKKTIKLEKFVIHPKYNVSSFTRVNLFFLLSQKCVNFVAKIYDK